MQVVGDGNGLGLVQAQEVGDDALEGMHGFGGFQIADVLADEDLVANAESDSVFEMRAHSEDGGDGSGEGNRQRGVAASTAQQARFAIDHPGYAVIDMPLDGPVVQ